MKRLDSKGAVPLHLGRNYSKTELFGQLLGIVHFRLVYGFPQGTPL
jgi:hypothetical protein